MPSVSNERLFSAEYRLIVDMSQAKTEKAKVAKPEATKPETTSSSAEDAYPEPAQYLVYTAKETLHRPKETKVMAQNSS